MINTVFFGTHQFSIFTLQILKQNPQINLIAVVTTPDKKIGRKQILTANPVKKWAIENNIKIIEFANILDVIEKEKLELGIISYFGYLIPKNVIDQFEKGILNIHPSLLPDYAGASPLEWAILNGEVETGVTLIKINEKFDKGEILDQETIKLDYSKTKNDIYQELFLKGSELLNKNLNDYLKEHLKLTTQPTGTFKKAPKLEKTAGYIDLLKENNETLSKKIMALNPWPTTYTTLQNIADYYKLTPTKQPNLKVQIVKVEESLKTIATEHTLTPQVEIRLTKLKPEGKNEMSFREFKNGYLKD